MRIADETMYVAIENLLKQKLIENVKTEDKRRKVYKLSDTGLEVIKLEIERLRHLVRVSEELEF